MFCNQNKQVLRKFQIETICVNTKASGPTPIAGETIPVRPSKMASSARSPYSPRNPIRQPTQPMQSSKAPTKPSVCTTAGGVNSSVKNYASPSSLAGAAPLSIYQSATSSSRIYRPSTSSIFDYNLSKEEQQNYGYARLSDCPHPMKSVPADEMVLLQSGQRDTYLKSRYMKNPDAKYNYPEATSWRYGWFYPKDT